MQFHQVFKSHTTLKYILGLSCLCNYALWILEYSHLIGGISQLILLSCVVEYFY